MQTGATLWAPLTDAKIEEIHEDVLRGHDVCTYVLCYWNCVAVDTVVVVQENTVLSGRAGGEHMTTVAIIPNGRIVL